uniref:DUF1754-domain-containing protein n=1 Tax=Chromera velia CCMP2878 TaxID=1169474 RepID=A0A0G4GRH4_9ALVE|eukprot:Cvel_23052.t1-p1 / transcript=Cvel_23052.t1 / gene=Cvel_23052 / organism=Chromera_velia_CCMP2878 / gene_product=Protein FAM32A, putative / transcript_product=Protein FAM32A, putative / location=Cvel_scaffold2332:26690-27085(+) / protein_length=132 / sequence_SO=supercontig / SO=protein_coding / is_pseudo=false
MPDDYANVVRKSLKLKKTGGIEKKKKKKDKDKKKDEREKEHAKDEVHKVKQREEQEGGKETEETQQGAGAASSSSSSSTLTTAQKAFKMAQEKRVQQRVDNALELTHRQRMERFNEHLASLSEHFDTPKIAG